MKLDMMINEQIYRKHLAKYAYEHGWTSEQITEALHNYYTRCDRI